MVRVRVGVLGPTTFRVDETEVRLAPLTVKVLLRLVAAEGDAVSADQIYRDLWPLPASGKVGRPQRTEVQKRVHELRRAIGAQPDGATGVVTTERVLAGPYPQSAYRLVLATDQLDYTEFRDLVNRAAHSAPTAAAAMLTRALTLWRGKPLADATGQEFASSLARRLTSLREAACRDLIRAHTELGHPGLALPLAEGLAAELPDDPTVARTLLSLREQLRSRHTGEILRREFSGLHVTLTVRRGDLFDQADANWAVGFGDTFDTLTENDVLISRESVQGQLLERIYGGDKERLDTDLRKRLRRVTPVTRETVQSKPKGKRTRYPVGTVAALPLNGRRIFAFVHCRQGLDLVTRSSPAELRLSLDQLWRSVRVHGMLKPLAIPLVGSGLARILELSREQIMIMIIDTFVKGCKDERCTPELRIVIQPSEVEQIRMLDVARFVETLDQDGREPHD